MWARDRTVGKMSIPLQEDTSEHAFSLIDFENLFFSSSKDRYVQRNPIHFAPLFPQHYVSANETQGFYCLPYFSEYVWLKQIVSRKLSPKGIDDIFRRVIMCQTLETLL